MLLGICYSTVLYKLRIKPGTVGRPVVWTEEKIAPDGEILVRGPQVFKEYWQLPKETKDAFTEDGWFKTGDIGSFDEEGFLIITDRIKDLFVTSGGKNIAPHPIEIALVTMPSIRLVLWVTGESTSPRSLFRISSNWAGMQRRMASPMKTMQNWYIIPR